LAIGFWPKNLAFARKIMALPESAAPQLPGLCFCGPIKPILQRPSYRREGRSYCVRRTV